MDRHEVPRSALNIALLRGLYLTIIMVGYEGPHSALSIALPRGSYLTIILDRQ
jgi:hypothetical protein